MIEERLDFLPGPFVNHLLTIRTDYVTSTLPVELSLF